MLFHRRGLLWPGSILRIDFPVESCKITVIWFHFAKSRGSLKRLKLQKPRYGPFLFSLICLLLLKDLSFILFDGFL